MVNQTHEKGFGSLIDHRLGPADQDQRIVARCRQVLLVHAVCHTSFRTGPAFGHCAESMVQLESAIGLLHELVQFFAADCSEEERHQR